MLELPKHILNSLKKNQTSLGEHPAYPPEQEEMFIVNAVAQKFSKLCDGKEIVNIDEMKNELGRLITQCKKIETKNKNALEELCMNIVTELFSIPEDTVSIDVEIVDGVNVDDERFLPENTDDYSFDDIKDMRRLTDEIYKRRMLNALVAGASVYYSSNISQYIREIFDIDSELPSLYKKILSFNEILLFFEKDTLDKDSKNNTEGGKVSVEMNSAENSVHIKADGIIFPILLEETIKGILELAISHGLPNERSKAEYVIKKADFRLAELWDMRLGMTLWELIVSQIDDMETIEPNFFLMTLAELPVKTFNSCLGEIFAKTNRGKKILQNIISKISSEKDKDEFNDFINQNNNKGEHQIDDDYYTGEELINDSVLTEDDEYDWSNESENKYEDLYDKFVHDANYRYRAVYELVKNGYLIHGTEGNFDEFDPNKVKGGSRAQYGFGAYFTDAAYKCEKYGGEYQFVYFKPFNVFELEDEVSENDVISQKIKEYEYYKESMYDAKYERSNAETVAQYEEADKRYEEMEQKIKEVMPNDYVWQFFYLYKKITKNTPRINYVQLLGEMDEQGLRNIKTVASIFQTLGYDCFHAENQYVIFNFAKLNKYLVRDRGALLQKLCPE